MVIKEPHRITLVCAALVIGTALLYWPVVAFDFVNFDDQSYVFGNPNLSGGFSWRGLLWCFQAGYASNWHPLTWMTHMLDCQIFGLNPAGHHAVNLALHTANVVLLFLMLKRMTAALWRSALVAALFAWHPLHVESVAWVAELKDVMSTLFWMLALWAYIRYAEEDKAKASAMMAPEGRDSKKKAFYIAALLFFALGLMAKAMVVTLPCALLLLDFWPLRRFQVASNGSAPVSPWLRLVREKAPFFLLAAGACILTVVAQARGGSVSSLQQWPVGARFANALEAYLSYLEKLAWPSGMSVIYPLASSYLFGKIALAVLLLAILSAAAIVGRASRPYGLIGWLWFLGTLVPVIGILQVGAQNMADRYTYIPSIGLFIAVCWGAHDASRRWRYGRPAVIVVAMATLLALASNTRVQLNYWRNSDTLFRHALAIDPGNVIAHRSYGAYLRDAGRLEESRMQCQRVVEIASTYAMGYTFLARTLMLENKQDDAIATLRTGLKFKPDMTVARCDLAAALFSAGRWREAETELETGLAYDATDPDLHCLLAMDTAMQGHFLQAEQQCAEALRVAPDFPAVHVELAQILAAQRKTAGAIAEYRRALKLQPDLPAALNELAWILATSADPKFRNGAEAASMAARACELTRNREALGTLAAACAEAGRFDQAASLAQRAHDVAVANGDTNAALRNLELKKTYQARQPFYDRDPSPPFRGTCPPSVHAIR